MDQLFAETLAQSDYRLKIDLQTQTVMTPAGNTFEFEVNPSRRQALLNGLDEIGETLAHADDIRAYEARRKGEAPWLFTE
jgi:3-isopropylmalate/(R)-2-methylmalate dehydratase small subunit